MYIFPTFLEILSVEIKMFSKYTKGGSTDQTPETRTHWLVTAHGTNDAERAVAQSTEHARRIELGAQARAETAALMDGVRARIEARAVVAAKS